MPIDLAKLEQLLTIARTGNFTRASMELGITQPALTRNVSIMEQRYGVKIFDRGRSGASLTPLGRQVLEQAELLVGQATVVEKNIQLVGRGESGQINLGIGPQLAELLLPQLGLHMLQSRPLVRVKYTLKTVDLMLPHLRDGSMDLMFCAIDNIPLSSDLAVEPVGTLKLGFLARAGHPLETQSRVTMADLTGYPLAIESARLPPAFPSNARGLSCENSRILRDIALASDTVWFSSPLIVDNDIREGSLIVIDVVDLPLRQVEIGIVRLAQCGTSPAMEAIAEFINDRFALAG